METRAADWLEEVKKLTPEDRLELLEDGWRIVEEQDDSPLIHASRHPRRWQRQIDN